MKHPKNWLLRMFLNHYSPLTPFQTRSKLFPSFARGTNGWVRKDVKQIENRLQKPVLKTFQVGPSSIFTQLKERVRRDLKRLKNPPPPLRFGSEAKALATISGMMVAVGEIVGGLSFGIFGHLTVKKGRDPIIVLGKEDAAPNRACVHALVF